MKLGFIGCGVMANAMMGGMIESGILKPEDIIGADPSEASREKTKAQNGIEVTSDNLEVIEKADIVFFTIKPQYYTAMIQTVKDYIRPEQVIISIGAGRTLSYLDEQFDHKPVKVVRVMPNTPAQVNAGMTAMCPNQYVTQEESDIAYKLLSSFGRTAILGENLFDLVTSLSGATPALVFMMIEAMADAGVQGGMFRPQAYEFAAQTVFGAAKMMLESGKHPGELKDMVTSPAGTTIALVRKLEEKGFRSAVMEGVIAGTERSIEMQKM